jgi:hypothetical protein
MESGVISVSRVNYDKLWHILIDMKMIKGLAVEIRGQYSSYRQTWKRRMPYNGSVGQDL